jgi:hypothetical protein
MPTKAKKDSSASASASVIFGRPSIKYTVEDAVKLVRVSFLVAAAKLTL